MDCSPSQRTSGCLLSFQMIFQILRCSKHFTTVRDIPGAIVVAGGVTNKTVGDMRARLDKVMRGLAYIFCLPDLHLSRWVISDMRSTMPSE